MAEKRMFTKQIIDSDAFLDMPVTAQNLYFHLNLNADDDGFVNSPKKVARTCCASEKDILLLAEKRLIFAFPSGIIVIKHWRMHNTLQNDRYKPTVYKDEMALLEIKENKSYTLKNEHCFQTVSKVDTQYSIGLDKNRIDKYNKEITHADPDPVSDDPKKQKKNVYGTMFKLVRLTDDEYQKIKDQDLLSYIDRLDEYIASKGKAYKSHYATILTWHRSDLEKGKQITTKRSEPIPDYKPDTRVEYTDEQLDAFKKRMELNGEWSRIENKRRIEMKNAGENQNYINVTLEQEKKKWFEEKENGTEKTQG